MSAEDELSPNAATRLAQLERLWAEKYIQQPKLPSSALLTGALAMALGFGAVLFLMSAWMRSYAWIWIVLALICGAVNRVLSARWYRDTVVPWDEQRRATKAEMERLRGGSPHNNY
jgi:hypothetical protein